MIETFFAGLLAWSLAEYLVHRFVLHRRDSRFWPEHVKHHKEPLAETGVPFNYAILIHAVCLGFAYILCGEIGSAFVAGAGLGYLAYVTIHEYMHRAEIKPGHWLYANKLRHDLHHKGWHKNYGVTTPLWDILLWTYLPGK